jgi:DNA invertase Pin-like site-specific DNA recombinase
LATPITVSTGTTQLPPADKPSRRGRFMLHMLVSVAEFEAGMISTRIKSALAQAKRRGVVLGGDRGHVPFKAHRAVAAKAVSERADARASAVMPSIRAFHYRKKANANHPGPGAPPSRIGISKI